MASPSDNIRLATLELADKEEAAPLPFHFQRVLAAIRKFHDFGQLRLQTADETCFVMLGSAFDMNREIIKALLETRCTVSVLPSGSGRVTVVVGRLATQPTTMPMPMRTMPPTKPATL